MIMLWVIKALTEEGIKMEDDTIMEDKDSLIILKFGLFLLYLFIFMIIGWVIYWLSFERQGQIYSVREFSDDEKNKLSTMYLYLISSYCMTLISSMYFFTSPTLMKFLQKFRVNIITGTVLITAVLTHHQEVLPYLNRYKEKKNWIWFTQSIVIGPCLTYFGSKIYTRSIFDTLLSITLSTLTAFTAPDSMFESLVPYVNLLYSGVFISSILNFLFVPPINPFSVFLLVLDFLSGTSLYFLVFTVNTMYVLRQARGKIEDPINNATVMYLCTLNLYLRLSMRYLVYEMQ